MSILTSDEIARSTGAAWSLFKGDGQAMRRLDTTFEGFWRSFAVILLLLPAIGILIASERLLLIEQTAMSEETFPSGLFVASRLVGYVVGWFDYPLILALLAGPLQLRKRFVPLVVALNWMSIIAAVPVTVPSLLHVLGLIDADTAGLLGFIALGLVIRYQYVVTRLATGAPVGFCAGLVALDYVASIALSAFVTGLTGI
jgi:hypothetical protein